VSNDITTYTAKHVLLNLYYTQNCKITCKITINTLFAKKIKSTTELTQYLAMFAMYDIKYNRSVLISRTLKIVHLYTSSHMMLMRLY